MYERIRNLLAENNLMQTELESLLNFTHICYFHYEKGRRDIPAGVLIQLADY